MYVLYNPSDILHIIPWGILKIKKQGTKNNDRYSQKYVTQSLLLKYFFVFF